MIRLRLYRAAFFVVGTVLYSYCLLVFRGPLLPPQVHVALLVLLVFIEGVLLCLWKWQGDRVEAERQAAAAVPRQVRETWYTGHTQLNRPVQPARAVSPTTYSRIPVPPPLRQPGERPEFNLPGADLKARLITELDREDPRPWGDLAAGEDTGDVTRT